MKRLKLGSLEIAVGVESREEPESAPNGESDAEHGSGSRSWWWERQTHPFLAEAFVLVFAIGLIAYVAFDPHSLSAHPRFISASVAAALLVLVIARRGFRRLSGR